MSTFSDVKLTLQSIFNMSAQFAIMFKDGCTKAIKGSLRDLHFSMAVQNLFKMPTQFASSDGCIKCI